MSSILLMCALPEEKAALVKELNRESETIILSKKFSLEVQKFSFNGHDIYVKETGMGNVNAGVGLALLLEKINIDQIVLIGVGGALSEKLHIGDMVIATSVLQHDYFSSLDIGEKRMYPGELILSSEDAQKHNPLICSKENILKLDIKSDLKVFHGVVLSGSEFVGTTERKRTLASLHPEALLVDMEASAIGFIANKAQIPFLIAKTVSDRLLPDGSIESDFKLFLEQASKNAATITLCLLERLGKK